MDNKRKKEKRNFRDKLRFKMGLWLKKQAKFHYLTFSPILAYMEKIRPHGFLAKSEFANYFTI